MKARTVRIILDKRNHRVKGGFYLETEAAKQIGNEPCDWGVPLKNRVSRKLEAVWRSFSSIIYQRICNRFWHRKIFGTYGLFVKGAGIASMKKLQTVKLVV